jgi:hypothetical protein
LFHEILTVYYHHCPRHGKTCTLLKKNYDFNWHENPRCFSQNQQEEKSKKVNKKGFSNKFGVFSFHFPIQDKFRVFAKSHQDISAASIQNSAYFFLMKIVRIWRKEITFS